MPRFQIVVGETEVLTALSYLILVQGMEEEAAMDWLNNLLVYRYIVDGKTKYALIDEAKGEAMFELKKKYRALFGQGVQIKKID